MRIRGRLRRLARRVVVRILVCAISRESQNNGLCNREYGLLQGRRSRSRKSVTQYWGGMAEPFCLGGCVRAAQSTAECVPTNIPRFHILSLFGYHTSFYLYSVCTNLYTLSIWIACAQEYKRDCLFSEHMHAMKKAKLSLPRHRTLYGPLVWATMFFRRQCMLFSQSAHVRPALHGAPRHCHCPAWIQKRS